MHGFITGSIYIHCDDVHADDLGAEHMWLRLDGGWMPIDPRLEARIYRDYTSDILEDWLDSLVFYRGVSLLAV